MTFKKLARFRQHFRASSAFDESNKHYRLVIVDDYLSVIYSPTVNHLKSNNLRTIYFRVFELTKGIKCIHKTDYQT